MRSSVISAVLSTALLFISATAHAVEPAATVAETRTSSYRGGAGYGMVGARPLDPGTLPGETVMSLGGGGHFQRGRLLFGGEGHGLIGVVGGDSPVTLSGAYGFACAGGVLVSGPHFSLHALLGVGGGAVTVRGGDAGTSAETPGGLLLDGALGVDYRIINPFDRGGRGFVLIGLRGGYTFARYDGNWTVGAGSDFGLTGPYLRLMIGAGGRK